MARWTREHETKVQEIMALLTREAVPFDDMSRRARKRRRNQPFAAWARTYLPHYFSCPDAPFHALADEAVEERGIPVIMCWARGYGKSVRYNLARTLWRICQRDWHFVIVGARSEDVAAENMHFIRVELEHNARISADYGEAVAKVRGPDEDWIALDTRVWARGIGQSPKGARYRQYRPDAFVGDDLEDDIIARNPRTLEKLWEWLMASVWPALEGAGTNAHFILLCTPYGRGSIAARAKEMAEKADEQGRPLARYFEYPALDADGESAWPARYSTAQIQRAAAIMGSRLFRREMLCKIDTEDAPFRPEWIRSFDSVGSDRTRLRVAAFLDPSASAAENRDFKALVVLGRCEETGAIYCLHAWIRHASPGEMLSELQRVHDVYSPGILACESNGFQSLIWPLMQARKMKLAVRAITNTTNKADRILSNQGEFERELCYFDPQEGDQRRLVDQFLDYGRTTVHDDGPDAWDGARRLLPGGRTAEVYYRGAPRESGLEALISI